MHYVIGVDWRIICVGADVSTISSEEIAPIQILRALKTKISANVTDNVQVVVDFVGENTKLFEGFVARKRESSHVVSSSINFRPFTISHGILIFLAIQILKKT